MFQRLYQQVPEFLQRDPAWVQDPSKLRALMGNDFDDYLRADAMLKQAMRGIAKEYDAAIQAHFKKFASGS